MRTKRSRINRYPARSSYNKKIINKIIDEAPICHVAFVEEDQPFVIPTIHSRMGDKIIFHGSKSSRLIKHIARGNKICVAITILDELVLARSIVHHSMNYRSVIIFGRGEEINDDKRKLKVFKAISNHLLPGRWEDARQPNKKEIESVAVVSVKIEEASAKIRTGPPIDDNEDYELNVWAGVLPVLIGFGKSLKDSKLKKGIRTPDYLKSS